MLIHTMGPFIGDKELCLREFAKFLMDRAYTWYTTLKPGSIKTWDKMMERFCAKYYLGEDKVTFQSLQMVRQRPREDPVQFIKSFEDVSLDCYEDYEEKELVETCISNMLFDYRLNLENLCITQFADLLQRTRRTVRTMRTKRVLVPQAMIASIGEKRKRLEGKMVKEPPVIPCIAEELNHFLNKWIGYEIGHQLRKKGRIPCLIGFITMSSTLPRTIGPSVGFFTRSLGREPWNSLKKNPKCIGTLYPTIRGREWWL